MKLFYLLKSFLIFLKKGILNEYTLLLIQRNNPTTSFGKNFICTNFSKFNCSKGTTIANNVLINCGGEKWSEFKGSFKCGENCYIGPNTTIFAAGEVEFENNVLISPSVNIVSHQHIYNKTKPYNNEKNSYKKVKLCNNVWVGTNATILPGVEIGENSIVAANSVVTKSFPKNVIVAGVPASIIKKLD